MLRLRIRYALLPLALVSICGCGGIQDSDQPAVGSISVKADRGDDTPVVAPGKKAPAEPK